MKRFISLLALMAIVASYVHGFEVNGLRYEINSDRTSVTVYGTGNHGGVIIPESVEYSSVTYSVTSIGNSAFIGCNSLTWVTIPNSVTSIGGFAFKGCSALTSIKIPNSVTSIDDSAFDNCKLFRVEISDLAAWCGITFGNTWANPLYFAHHLYMNGNEIKDLVIPNSVTSIGNYAFSGCSCLTSVTIPNSVKTIGNKAFDGCSGLTSVTIGNSVTSIGYSAFSGCNNIETLNIDNNEFANISFFSDSKTKIKTLILGNSVTSIGNYAFDECSGLTSVTIPNFVKTIGNYAFYKCSGLAKVEISDLAAWCGITFGNTWANPLYFAHHLYMNGNEIKDLVIPNSVTSIGNYAFYNCSGLTSVTIPNSVKTIGNTAFDGCSGLTEPLTIPNSVTSIGSYAFSGCSGLTSVTIPNSVKTIGNSAFNGCCGLTSVINRASTPQKIESSAFSDVNIKSCKLYVPFESIDAYKAANVWKDFDIQGMIYNDGLCYVINPYGTWTTVTVFGTGNDGAVVIPNTVKRSGTTYSVTSIGSYAFRGCSGLTSIEIPNSVTSIGSYAFRGCSGLTSIEIPNSVTSIDEKAFEGCTGLTNLIWNAKNCSSMGDMPKSNISTVTIGNEVEILPDNFLNGSKITEITIPNSVTTIGNNAFSGCNGLTSLIWNAKNCDSMGDMPKKGIMSVTIGNEVEKLPDYFVSGSKITSVTIPNSVTTIGNYAFTGCVGLTSVSIGNSVTEIGDYAFDQLGSLKSLTIGNSVTLIGYCAFRDCSGLTGTLTIPNSVKIIKTAAFQNCSGLTGALIIPNSVMEIDRVAFQGCNGFTSLTIPASVAKVENEAFSECDGLMSVNWNAKNCEITLGDWGNKLAPFDLPRIKTFTFGNEVERIPQYLCYGLSGLSSIEIPNSVTSIGNSAFHNCSGLTGPLTIPNSVTTIGENAFNNCSDLKSVTIGNSVKTIGEGAFDGCSGLAKVEISDLAAWCGIDFGDAYANPLDNAHHLYLNGSEIKDLVIPNSVTSIRFAAFWNCSGLTSVTIPNSVTSIGKSAFCYCSSLTSATIGDSVTEIGIYAFADCSGLTSVTNYALTPQSINDYVFEGVDIYNCKLYVWHESLRAYRLANVWKYFDIQDMGGVEDVEVDKATKEVEGYYDLKGVRLEEPIRGQVNIVRYTDGTAKKIVN